MNQNQISAVLTNIFDDLQRQVQRLRVQPGFDAFGCASTIITVLVVVACCWAVSLSLKRAFKVNSRRF